MDRKLTAVALASVMVLSVFGVAGAGVLGGVSAQAGNQDTATVTTSGTGEVTAEPDQAVVHLSVTATGDNASEATDRLAANVSTLRATLDDENLSVVSVETTSFHVGPEDRDRRSERGQERGQDDDDGDDDDDEERTYVARQSFAVTTDDVDAVGSLIDTAVGGGADEVHGVQFTLSDDRRQELRADAIDDAVADARFQAEAVASSTGLALGNVKSVTVRSGHGPFHFAAVEADTAGGTSIDPSPVSVSATVDITYNATSD